MDLKIDEEYIAEVCKDAAVLMKTLLTDAKTLENKSLCYFKRYMALLKITTVLRASEFGFDFGAIPRLCIWVLIFKLSQ